MSAEGAGGAPLDGAPLDGAPLDGIPADGVQAGGVPADGSVSPDDAGGGSGAGRIECLGVSRPQPWLAGDPDGCAGDGGLPGDGSWPQQTQDPPSQNSPSQNRIAVPWATAPGRPWPVRGGGGDGRASGRRPRPRWLAWLLSGLALLYKAKFLLLFGSVFLSMLVYGLAFGWAFGIGLVVLLGIHETGHALAIRRRGMSATLPVFIPFLGALIGLRQRPRDAAEEAYIAVAGPLFGLAASFLAWWLYDVLGLPVLAVLASTGMMVHIFNLLPVVPLDGGRTVAFLRWKAWIPGFMGLLAVLFYNPFRGSFAVDPFALLILAFIAVSFYRRASSAADAAYDAIPPRAKWGYGLLWVSLLALSVFGFVHLPLA